MRYRIHVQHDPRRGEPVILVDSEEAMREALRQPGAQWARDLVTGEAIRLVGDELERHESEMSRDMLAAQASSETVQ